MNLAETRSIAAGEAQRWQAVQARDPSQDGHFVYAVRTTGVYCRPSCPSRHALRANVVFYDEPAQAQAAGFRACRRCRPDLFGRLDRAAEQAVAAACQMIESAEQAPTLTTLAQATGFSAHYLHRCFKAQVGITPRAYAMAVRQQRARQRLSDGATVTAAIHDAGYGSSSRFYAGARAMLGMTPTRFRDGGRGTRIRFACRDCSLGLVLVGATDEGISSVLLGDDSTQLQNDLQQRFPLAQIAAAGGALDSALAEVITAIDTSTHPGHLPLDVRGTAFEHRVWAALRELRPGETATYTDIAERIGKPTAARAVARACAANPVAVLIPCHRVIGKNGSLAGYRWGLARKRELLERERADRTDRAAVDDGPI